MVLSQSEITRRDCQSRPSLVEYYYFDYYVMEKGNRWRNNKWFIYLFVVLLAVLGSYFLKWYYKCGSIQMSGFEHCFHLVQTVQTLPIFLELLVL